MKRKCIHCGKEFDVKRNKDQLYCDDKECQKARRNKWQRDKRTNDPAYQDNQKRANDVWREKKS